MNHSKPHIIHERSNIIPISPSSPTNKNLETEYSLKENFFDPSKSSPPNEFMTKLELRIKNYNISGISVLNNADSFNIK
jgi:hypothetical protein